MVKNGNVNEMFYLYLQAVILYQRMMKVYTVLHARIWYHSLQVREEPFLFELIVKALSIKIELAEATEEGDRIHILNSIMGATDQPHAP